MGHHEGLGRIDVGGVPSQPCDVFCLLSARRTSCLTTMTEFHQATSPDANLSPSSINQSIMSVAYELCKMFAAIIVGDTTCKS